MADQIMNERITGARTCVELLKKLTISAENLPESAHDARVFFDIQRRDAKALVDALGPFTPVQEGAILSLAEYIHECETTGQPNIDRWKPCAAYKPDEFEALIAEINGSD